MKSVGYLLLIAGFLGGAFATALDVRDTQWLLFWSAAIVAALGVMLLKRGARSAARSEVVLTANRATLRESLDIVVAGIESLQAKEQSDSRLRTAIDDLQPDLQRFADARESLVHLAGMQAYADIMSEFAAGERYLNRVWSASADGYTGEATDYLERAARQFRKARDAFAAAGLAQ